VGSLIVGGTLPDLEVILDADDPGCWVGVFDGSVLVGLGEVVDEGDARRARVFVPIGAGARLRVKVARFPAELAVVSGSAHQRHASACDRVTSI